MSDLAVAGDIADGGKPALLDVAQVVRRARQALTVGGSPRWARDIVLAGLDKFGRSADLLWVLAEIEFIDGDVAAGRDAMKEASTLDPTSPALIIKSLRMLGGSGCWQEALAIIRSIPASMHQEPLVRTESGNFYWLCKCPAHAVAAFGKPKDLPRQSRKVWLSCWLRSGGPVNSLRRRALSWEAEALQVLDEPPPHVEAVCGVPELDPRQVLRVRVSLEKYNFRFARIFFHEIAWRRTAFRLLPLVAILVWIGLIYFVRAYVVASYPQDLSDFILSAAVGIVPFFFFARLWFDSRGWSRVSRGRMGAHLMVFLAGVAAVNLAFSRASISDQSRDGAVLSGLMSGVLLLTCLNLAATLNEIYGDRRIRRIIREDPLIL